MSTSLDKQAIKLWRKEWSTDMKSAMWSGTEVCRFAAVFATQVREQTVQEVIDAIANEIGRGTADFLRERLAAAPPETTEQEER